MRTRRWVGVAALLLAAGCAGNGGELQPAPPTSSTVPPPPAVASITPVDAESLVGLPSVTVIDVRTAAEFGAGHLPGAVLVDYEAGGFEAAVADYPFDATYIVYSNGDERAITAGRVMIDLGFIDVRDLVGGYDAWVATGQAVET